MDDDPWIGRLLSDRYRIVAPLGRGGMGMVYRAEHVLMKKEVAVKLLHAELGLLDEVSRRFEREAQSASRLSHPNIISVTDFGRTSDGTLFLVMELLHGEPLTAVLERGRLPPSQASAILTQILRALEAAHGQGVVHRDLKPDNVFLVRRDDDDDPVEAAARGKVKLLDFGIAKIDAAADGAGERLTQAGVVFGTPEYISPEQALGEPADARADLYSAGVILFEMLAGRRPFVADSKVTLISMHLTKAPPTVREVCPEAAVPEPLERVIARAMEKRRDDRFPSATVFREELAKAAAAPLRTSSIHPRVEPIRRLVTQTVLRAEKAGVPYPRIVLAVASALAAAVVLVLVVVAVRPSHAPQPKPPPPDATADLRRAEELLSRGDLAGARAALQQQLSMHPKVARVHYLLGNLHVAEKEPGEAIASYRDAIQLDPGYRGDAALLASARELLDSHDKPIADAALRLLADDVGAPGLDRLVDCAKSCREFSRRRAAAEAVVKLGGAAQLPKEATTTDAELARLVDELDSGRTCKDRRHAVVELRDLGDPRAVEPLKRARDRRGGLFGLSRANGCALRDIDEALRVLGSKP